MIVLGTDLSAQVDREERPDVDRLYMTFLQATSGGGGWPMSVCKSRYEHFAFLVLDVQAVRLQGSLQTYIHSSLGYVCFLFL